jgi:hypothetical protein
MRWIGPTFPSRASNAQSPRCDGSFRHRKKKNVIHTAHGRDVVRNIQVIHSLCRSNRTHASPECRARLCARRAYKEDRYCMPYATKEGGRIETKRGRAQKILWPRDSDMDPEKLSLHQHIRGADRCRLYFTVAVRTSTVSDGRRTVGATGRFLQWSFQKRYPSNICYERRPVQYTNHHTDGGSSPRTAHNGKVLFSFFFFFFSEPSFLPRALLVALQSALDGIS